MNATTPLSSSEIARDHYPGLSPDSFRRAFARDREMLADCGVSVVERRRGGDESLWEADEGLSFARGAELDPTDAAALELACRPLVADPSFPLASDLRLALAKVSRAFSETLAVGRVRTPGASRALGTLRTCLTKGIAAQVTYVDARGSRSERTLAPYGFFGLRGCLYLVAARLDEGGTPVEESIRTYRVDRFSDARPLEGTHFSVPDDFSVEDWRRLPFQIGGEKTDVTFLVPAEREQDVRRASLGQGSFVKKDGGLHWSVGACSIDEAASWAVAEGVFPVFPKALVDAWTAKLEGVVSHGA